MDELYSMNTLMRQLLSHLMSAVEHADLYDQVGEAGNSPGWIVGHLVVVNQLGMQMLGGEGPSKQDLLMFGPGSSGKPEPDIRPSKDELLAREETTATELRAAIQNAGNEVLLAPQPSQVLKERFPLVKDMLGHMLVSHLSLHVGQLSTWRRAKGFPSILQLP